MLPVVLPASLSWPETKVEASSVSPGLMFKVGSPSVMYAEPVTCQWPLVSVGTVLYAPALQVAVWAT